MDIRNHHIGIDCQLCLKRALLGMWIPNRFNRTYVEDVKDPDKILLPRSNLTLIALGEDESVYHTPFTMLDDLPLDLGQGSATDNVGKCNSRRGNYQSGSRSQLSDRIEDGLVELIQFPPL